MLRTSAAAAALTALAVLLAGCGGDDGGDDRTGSDDSSAGRTHAPLPEPIAGGPQCSFLEDGSPASRRVELPPSTAVFDGPVGAVIETNQGDIPITMDAAATPCTVTAIASLATQGFYDDTPCHRLTSTPSLSVLQCGDPDGTGGGGPGFVLPDELDNLPAPDPATGAVDYPAGTLAMANTGNPDSGGSQFFMVYEDSLLPPTYTQFGTVSEEGLEVLRTIAEAGDQYGAGDGPPVTEVQIEWFEIETS